MLHACVERFDVMDGRGNILGCHGLACKDADTAPARMYYLADQFEESKVIGVMAW
jgi:hypothetical protein